MIKVLALLVFGILLTGCMSAQLPEASPVRFESDSVPKVREVPESRAEEANDRDPIGPKWKRVVYRGTVQSGNRRSAVDHAVVSIFEGEDRLFTTLTDERGDFELPAELYGIEFEGEGKSREWSPEIYYSLRVDGGEAGEMRRSLRELTPGETIKVSLDPGNPPPQPFRKPATRG